MTTHSSACFCSKVPLMPSLKVSFSSQNKSSGVGAFKTGGLINSFLISLKAFEWSHNPQLTVLYMLLKYHISHITM